MADASQTASPAAPDTAPLSIPDFAAKIRKRDARLTPELVDDATLVRKFLERKPELTKYVQSSEPRRTLKRDRTPSADQQVQKFFENHPIVREAALGTASGLGIPESQHPVWDMVKGTVSNANPLPQTDDEKTFMSNFPDIPLPAYRLAKGMAMQTYGFGQEMFNAVDWTHIGDKIKSGKGRKEADLHLLKEGKGPQFAHGLAGLATMIVSAIEGGKKTPKAGEAVARAGEKVATTVKEGPTVTAQRMAGTGPALAKKTAEGALAEHETLTAKHAADTEKIQSGNAEADANFRTKIDRLNEDYDKQIADAREKHAADVGTRERTVAELQAKHADKVAEARADWVQKAYEAKQVAKDQAKVAGRKEALQSAQKSYAGMIIDNVKKTHEVVRSKLDQRWNQLRESIGLDRPVEAPNIYNSIEQSRAMLAGVPADLKIFNDLVKEITEKGAEVETEQGKLQKVPKESIPFDDARTQFSAVGEKAYAADGNLRRALFNVYEAYDKALSKTATEAGQGKTYAAIKSDWKRYMQDWHDMSSSATGGSPLARLYRAVDKPVAAAHVLGKFGDRLFATFARYKGDGAAPDLMAKLRNYSREEKALPKVKAPAAVPERAKLPATPVEPKPVASVEPKVADLESERTKKTQRVTEDRPASKPLPEALGPPPNLNDIIKKTQEAKREGAAEAKESSLTPGRHDAILAGLSAMGVVGLHNIAYAIPYTVARFGEAVLVSSEMGQRWLSRVTPADIKGINEVLAKAPDKKPAVQQAITDGLIAKAKKGEKLPPLYTFQGLLTRAQMGSILRLVAPPQQQPEPQPQTSSVQ